MDSKSIYLVLQIETKSELRYINSKRTYLDLYGHNKTRCLTLAQCFRLLVVLAVYLTEYTDSYLRIL